jgi:hypothetical protein
MKMAYVRYSTHSQWYIFWYCSPDDKINSNQNASDQKLAVWHENHRTDPVGTTFSYLRIKEMLSTDDYTDVAGYRKKDREIIRSAFIKFVHDVEKEYGTS